ncbi:membrane protein [Fervidicella metallireducens AeB]|uniref:Membrane protein n=1 Tax=Fervidicella metallireducens AeB TaxID=1403537 RepID=A0A017RU78_9CLOT|nr:AI-2E family transporter [Fervidicella metallireducens]EYE88232.1 membrane protein [Fervidicella metallireducens AeB]
MNDRMQYLKILSIILISIIFYKIIDNIKVVVELMNVVLSLISPLLWAFLIAYLLNPFMKYLQSKFKFNRAISILVVYFVVIGITILSITIITPKVVSNSAEILENLPDYINNTKEFLIKKISDANLLEKYGVTQYALDNVDYFIESSKNFLDESLNIILAKLIGFTSELLKFIIGLIISVYMLIEKESILKGVKRSINAFFSISKANKIITFIKSIDTIFSGYLTGKILDSVIMGIICFIGLILIKAPYSFLIGLLFGLANLIPYFGPIIGMAIAVAITLFYSPIKAIWVLIFILILEQFHAWWIAPKILGDKVGLKPFWIIVAIVVGGESFGVIGMFFAVPVMAIIKMYYEELINKRLSLKGNI